jgi:uncharacterized ferritin-like protein (DUF455 family)
VNAGLLPRIRVADPVAHAILERIYRDEIGHVATGTRWHRHWCQANGHDPEAHFATVLRARFPDQLASPWPLDRAGRLAAGFTDREMAVVAGV